MSGILLYHELMNTEQVAEFSIDISHLRRKFTPVRKPLSINRRVEVEVEAQHSEDTIHRPRVVPSQEVI